MIRLILIACLVCLQSTWADDTQPCPTIGVALSGGGAKGLAHIGVLKVLEEAGISADVVTGTSVGSIFGALYACGYTPAEMESLVVAEDWRPLFDDTPKRSVIDLEQKLYAERYQISLPIRGYSPGLPSGVMAGHNVGLLLHRWFWPAHHIRDFRELPRPFACVCTDLLTGEAVVLQSGILADAVRASMAIPGIFTSVNWDGRTLIDGGIVRNLPAEDARNLGATFVIGVDVSSPLRDASKVSTLLDVLDQSISFQGASATASQRTRCNLLIRPDVTDVNLLDFGPAKEIIARGEAAARKMLPELRALADSLGLRHRPKQVKQVVLADTVRIHQIRITGLHRTTENLVHGQLSLRPGKLVGERKLSRAIGRVYNSTFYERVSYCLDHGDWGDTLTVNVVEKNTSLLRVGFRYDSEDHAALLVNLTTRNKGLRGTMLLFDAKLGEAQQYTGTFFGRVGRNPRLAMRLQADHGRFSSKVTLKDDPRAVTVNSTLSAVQLLAGPVFWTSFLTVGGVTGYRQQMTSNSRDRSIPVRKTDMIATFTLVGWLDTQDRVTFSSRGVQLFSQYDLARKEYGFNARFRRFILQSVFRVPLKNRLTFGFGGDAAWRDGEPPEALGTVYLGGVNSFYGLRGGEISGGSMQMAHVQMQWEPWSKKFVVIRANAGNVSPEWDWEIKPKEQLFGCGITLGMLTIAGPIQFTVHDSALNDPLLHFRFGYTF